MAQKCIVMQIGNVCQHKNSPEILKLCDDLEYLCSSVSRGQDAECSNYECGVLVTG